MMGGMLDEIEREHGRFVLLDIHSYNYRRDVPDGDPAPQDEAPDINIGTFPIPRGRCAFLLVPLMEAMRAFDFGSRKLAVRETIALQGMGGLAPFLDEAFTKTGSSLARAH